MLSSVQAVSSVAFFFFCVSHTLVAPEVEAVFEALDKNRIGRLSKWEMHQYLKTYMHAMTPLEAESLRPLLLSRVTNDLFTDMDLDHNGSISSLDRGHCPAIYNV